MNDMKPIAPVHAKDLDQRAVEAIARETGTPLELAIRVYTEELSNLSRGARITQFVNVLASARARMKLQQGRAH